MKKKKKHFIFALTITLNSILLIAQEAPMYLIDSIYTADPSVHVFNNKIFIYPSHDIKTEGVSAAEGGHYNMKDYHVFSMENIKSNVTNHGVALKLEDIPWASKQLWAPDCEYRNGMYYFYFPAKDKNGIFKIGVAISEKPEGPFKPEKHPIHGSYSIDPNVFKDKDGKYYLYFGGISGGQLQRYSDNVLLDYENEPIEENALSPKIALLDESMIAFAEAPKDAIIIDENGMPLMGKDHDRRFFEGVWMHTYNEKYYLSYSTGNTHNLCYAIGDNPYGPFTYAGVLLSPVNGWTTHHSIVQIDGKWYLFYHDTQNSNVNYLREVKVRELKYNLDGTIIKMEGKD
tara:strand:- start:14408 stop:15439 length:1032 start_codon:yes stop_codon:yes gene_type:complete